MPLRRFPGRPGRDEPPAETSKTTVKLPIPMKAAYERLAAERRTTVHALLREAALEKLEREVPDWEKD